VARLSGEGRGMRFGFPGADEPALIDLPRFGRGEGREGGPRWGERPREQQWLLLELDLDYVRSSLLPGLLERHLGSGERLDYDIKIAVKEDPSTLIYESEPGAATRVAAGVDGSVGMFEVQFFQGFRRGGQGFGGDRGPGGGPPPFALGNRGRWLLS